MTSFKGDFTLLHSLQYYNDNVETSKDEDDDDLMHENLPDVGQEFDDDDGDGEVQGRAEVGNLKQGKDHNLSD